MLLNFAIFVFLRYMCAANCIIVLVLVLLFWIIYFVEEKNMLIILECSTSFMKCSTVWQVLLIC